MPADGSLINSDLVLENQDGGYNRRQQGVFGLNPLMSPKYSKFTPRDAEYRDTLARMYISLADAGPTLQSAYLASLPSDPATQGLASVLLGSNSKGGTGFIDFFLTSASEPFQEVMQVDKVMSDDYVAFFYGQSPPIFQYSGMLLNSMQDDQRSGFAKAYQLMLRGTQMARRGTLARMRYDSVIVSGVLTAHQQQLNSDNELAVPFSFSFLVKEYVILQNVAFNKVTTADYVKLAADAAVAALQPVGSVSGSQVRTNLVPPPTLAGVSTAGTEQNTTVVDPTQNPAQQAVTKGAAAQGSNSTTSNVYGTINSVVAPPPPPFVPTPSGFAAGQL